MDILKEAFGKLFSKKCLHVEKPWLWPPLETIRWFRGGERGFRQPWCVWGRIHSHCSTWTSILLSSASLHLFSWHYKYPADINVISRYRSPRSHWSLSWPALSRCCGRKEFNEYSILLTRSCYCWHLHPTVSSVAAVDLSACSGQSNWNVKPADVSSLPVERLSMCLCVFSLSLNLCLYRLIYSSHSLLSLFYIPGLPSNSRLVRLSG